MNDEPITTTEDGNPDVHGYPGEVNVDPAFNIYLLQGIRTKFLSDL